MVVFSQLRNQSMDNSDCHMYHAQISVNAPRKKYRFDRPQVQIFFFQVLIPQY
jgi:hypothetical protein